MISSPHQGSGCIGYCPTCEALFAAPQFLFVRSENVKISRVSAPCPQGHPAQLLDGTFTFLDDAVRLIDGPPLTREILSRMLDIVDKSHEGTTAGELAEAARQIHPSLGPLVEKLAGGDRSKHGNTFKLAVLGLIIALASKCSITMDVNRAFDQMRALAQSSGEVSDQHAKQEGHAERAKKSK